MQLIKDLSSITNIPESLLNKLVLKSNACIGYAVKENMYEGEENTLIDIGIGQLAISVSDDQIRYKFIPSRALESSIIKYIDNESELEELVADNLKQKILSVYKELC